MVVRSYSFALSLAVGLAGCQAPNAPLAIWDTSAVSFRTVPVPGSSGVYRVILRNALPLPLWSSGGGALSERDAREPGPVSGLPFVFPPGGEKAVLEVRLAPGDSVRAYIVVTPGAFMMEQGYESSLIVSPWLRVPSP